MDLPMCVCVSGVPAYVMSGRELFLIACGSCASSYNGFGSLTCCSVMSRFCWRYRLRWSRGSVLAFGTQVRGFKPGRSRRIFKGEKILSTPSLGGEVKPSVPCRRFAACKRSLELRGSRILDEICRNISRPQRVPPSVARGLSHRGREGTQRRRWERLKAGESYGNLPLRICPGCSVPEPYRSPDWVLVRAKTGLRAEY